MIGWCIGLSIHSTCFELDVSSTYVYIATLMIHDFHSPRSRLDNYFAGYTAPCITTLLLRV
jgi:hypothetical protein